MPVVAKIGISKCLSQHKSQSTTNNWYSFLPNDSELRLIETANLKKEHNYVPGDCKGTIMNSKRKCDSFGSIVVKNSGFFFLTTALEQSITNRKRYTE